MTNHLRMIVITVGFALLAFAVIPRIVAQDSGASAPAAPAAPASSATPATPATPAAPAASWDDPVNIRRPNAVVREHTVVVPVVESEVDTNRRVRRATVQSVQAAPSVNAAPPSPSVPPESPFVPNHRDSTLQLIRTIRSTGAADDTLMNLPSLGPVVATLRHASQPKTEEDRRMELKTQSLVEKLRKSEDAAEHAKLVDELTQVLDEHFELRMQQREQQIAELEKRLEKLREQIDQRRAAKDEIIALRRQTLVNEAKGLGF